MDALTRVLSLVPISGSLDFRCHFSSAWQLQEGQAPLQEIPYHMLMRGSARLEDAQGNVHEMTAGDIVLFPQGSAHRLHDGSGASVPTPSRREHDGITVITTEGDGEGADLLCGRFRLPSASAPLLLEYLPSTLLVRSQPPAGALRDAEAAVAARSQLASLVAFMRDEALQQGPGSEAILNHLSAALFGLILRVGSLVEEAPTGLLALSRDDRLRPALAAMFDAPATPWSLPQLAQLCAMSRATFIRRFEAALGRSASAFLLDLRMNLAADALSRLNTSVAGIGESVGYQSEAAFARAFKKHTSMTPARWRAQSRGE